MKKISTHVYHLSFIFTLSIMKMFYGMINNPGKGAHSLVTNIDNHIPFVKYFIMPYYLWYIFPYAVMIYLCLKDKDTYFKTIITVNISMVSCYIVFLLFQTTVPRPELVGNDIFTKLVRVIYNYDKPFNCFPSIHVITSFIMIKAIWESKVRNPLNVGIINMIGWGIIVSTVFVKQHVVLDGIAAIYLGAFLYNLVSKLYNEKVVEWQSLQFLSLPSKKKLESM